MTILWRGILVLGISAALVIGALEVGRRLPHEGGLAYTAEYLGSTEIHLLDVSRGFRFNLSWGGIPVWSPDGRYLAYTSGNRANQDVFIMDANGSHTRNLTPNSPHALRPTWSPDSQQIAFESFRDGNWDIYVADVCDSCTRPARNLTHHPGVDSSPSWSPDGRQIAFLSTRDGESEIYVMDADGSHIRELTRSSRTDLQPPVWSPDGKWIAFTSLRPGNWDVYVMDASCGDLPDGCEGEVRNLSLHPAQDSHPAWSPDGQWIAFTSRRDGNFEVYLVTANGGEPRNLTNNPNEDSLPAWSPDGGQIAFQSSRDRVYGDEIYVVDLASGETRRLTQSHASSQYPAWWP